MEPFTFTRRNRTQRSIGILICVYGALIALVISVNAAWWLMALLALPTLPVIWDIAKDSSAGLELDTEALRWHSGKRRGELNLTEIERFRFDTRWDFTVRVSAILHSGRRVRLPDEALPPHRQLETVLSGFGLAVERHHFRVF